MIDPTTLTDDDLRRAVETACANPNRRDNELYYAASIALGIRRSARSTEDDPVTDGERAEARRRVASILDGMAMVGSGTCRPHVRHDPPGGM